MIAFTTSMGTAFIRVRVRFIRYPFSYLFTVDHEFGHRLLSILPCSHILGMRCIKLCSPVLKGLSPLKYPLQRFVQQS